MIDTIIYMILPFIGSAFILYAFFYSMGRIGTNINVSRWKKQIVIWAYITVSLGMSLLNNGVINLLVMLFIPVIGHFLYNNLRLYIVYYISLVIAVYLTDMVVISVVQLFIIKGNIYFINSQAYYIVMIFTLRMIEFMVLKLLVGLIQRKHQERITRRQLIRSFVMPVFSIVNLFSMVFFLQIYISEENLVIFTVNIVMLIGLNIYFTDVFDVISKNNYLVNELNLQKQQQEIQSSYYENLEQKYDSTRKLVHDIRNHIQAMERLYEEQKNIEGCQYAQDVHDMLNQLGQKYYTSNKMLNIILNDKVQSMQSLGISGDIKISEVNLGFIRDVDITTMFANILDNAIEAASASVDKQIILRVAAVHDIITITLKNSFISLPLKVGNTFRSTKDNHEGLGIKNVERVVKNYKGDIQFEWGEKYFITRIMLTS